MDNRSLHEMALLLAFAESFAYQFGMFPDWGNVLMAHTQEQKHHRLEDFYLKHLNHSLDAFGYTCLRYAVWRWMLDSRYPNQVLLRQIHAQLTASSFITEYMRGLLNDSSHTPAVPGGGP